MQRSEFQSSWLVRPWLYAILVGVSYFAAAFFSLSLTQGNAGIATVWPASGVFAAALLGATSKLPFRVIGFVALASVSANMLFGATLAVAGAFTFANIVEGLAIAALVRRFGSMDGSHYDLRTILVFFAAAIIGSFLSATIATTLGGMWSAVFFVSWFTTVLLGALIVTPLLLTIAARLDATWRMPSVKRMASFCLLLALVAICSFAIIHANADQFLYLPLVGVVVATYAFGSIGAALSISAIAFAMILGSDPAFGETEFLGLDLEVLGLQFYLLSLFGAAWPLTALLTQKEQLIRRYADTNFFLKLAESTAHVGHWIMGKEESDTWWSSEVYRIHGLEQDGFSLSELGDLGDAHSFNLYHPEDRDHVRATLRAAMEDAAPFEYSARIVRPDGSIRHVYSAGQPHFSRSGQFDGLFGTFLDVTEHTENLEELRMSRREALYQAAEARRISETDELTGIANRRKVLSDLKHAGKDAQKQKSPLCVGIVDIDHFKLVNDRYGHAIGDAVLMRVAEIISAGISEDAIVGRLGGEEFLIVLPRTNERGGVAVMEFLRNRIAGESWGAGGPEIVTVSTGLAQLAIDGDISAVLKRADAALYAVKEGGRNAVRHAGSVRRFESDLDGFGDRPVKRTA